MPKPPPGGVPVWRRTGWAGWRAGRNGCGAGRWSAGRKRPKLLKRIPMCRTVRLRQRSKLPRPSAGSLCGSKHGRPARTCHLRNTALRPGSLRPRPASRWSRRRRIISVIRLWNIVQPDVGPDPRFKPGSTHRLSAPASRWSERRTAVPIAMPLVPKAQAGKLRPDESLSVPLPIHPRGKNRADRGLCGSGLDRRQRNG